MIVSMPVLHERQQLVRDTLAEDEVRVVVAYCGRRFGKTYVAAGICIACALFGGRVWWVGPTFPVASIGWRLLRFLASQLGPLVEINKAERMIEFSSGGYIQVKSADNPDSLRGEGLDLAVLDEAAFMRYSAFAEAIIPALADRSGKALLTTSPNGLNWVHELFVQGQAPNEDGIRSFRFRTLDNPHINPAEVERARRTLPRAVFDAEYEARPESGNDDATIPLEWIMAAVERWRERIPLAEGGGFPTSVLVPSETSAPERAPLSAIGADISDGGADHTILAPAYGETIGELIDATPASAGETMATAGRIAAIQKAGHAAGSPYVQAVVDGIGVGAGVVSRLLEEGLPVLPFIASEATKMMDPAGLFGFTNIRSAGWWHVRYLLDPEGPHSIALPPHQGMIADLSTPRAKVRSGGVLAVETKDEIKKRIGRSTDYGDAVVMALWPIGQAPMRIDWL